MEFWRPNWEKTPREEWINKQIEFCKFIKVLWNFSKDIKHGMLDLHKKYPDKAFLTIDSRRENFKDPLPNSYIDAFKSIDKDPNNELIVAETNDYKIAGFMQMTFIPYLTYQSGWRCLIEGVRVNKNCRGEGIGKKLFEWGIQRAKYRNCHLVQLTSDKQRLDAIKFYEALGFKATHEGMKLKL